MLFFSWAFLRLRQSPKPLKLHRLNQYTASKKTDRICGVACFLTGQKQSELETTPLQFREAWFLLLTLPYCQCLFLCFMVPLFKRDYQPMQEQKSKLPNTWKLQWQLIHKWKLHLRSINQFYIHGNWHFRINLHCRQRANPFMLCHWLINECERLFSPDLSSTQWTALCHQWMNECGTSWMQTCMLKLLLQSIYSPIYFNIATNSTVIYLF